MDSEGSVIIANFYSRAGLQLHWALSFITFHMDLGFVLIFIELAIVKIFFELVYITSGPNLLLNFSIKNNLV